MEEDRTTDSEEANSDSTVPRLNWLVRRWQWIALGVGLGVMLIFVAASYQKVRAVNRLEALKGRFDSSPGTFLKLLPDEWEWWLQEKNTGRNWLVPFQEIKGAELGHSMMIDADFRYYQTSDADLIHLDTMPELQSLGLGGTRVTDAGLVHLEGLTGLEWLSLKKTKVTGEGFEHLRELTQLKTLILGETQVTDAGLTHLKAMTRLEYLYLYGTPVTDAGLIHLNSMTGLKELDLRGTRVTEDGLKRLRAALPSCRISD